MRGLNLDDELADAFEYAETADFNRLLGNRELRDECLRDRKVVLLPPQDIQRDSRQPRKDFDDEDLQELASSIDALGKNDAPITVFFSEERGCFVVKTGERRWRAVSKFTEKVKLLSCIIEEEPGEEELFDIRVQENLQKKSFNIVEEIEIYSHYRLRFIARGTDAVGDAIAAAMHKSKSMVSSIGGIVKAMDSSPLFRQVVETRKILSKAILIELANAINKDSPASRKVPLNNLLYMFVTNQVDRISREDAVSVRRQVSGEKPVPRNIVDLTAEPVGEGGGSSVGDDAGHDDPAEETAETSLDSPAEEEGRAQTEQEPKESALMRAGVIKPKAVRFIKKTDARADYETRSIAVKVGNGRLDYSACAELVSRLQSAMQELRNAVPGLGEQAEGSSGDNSL